MNYVLICDKKNRKRYESIFENAPNTVQLGTETFIRNGFVNKIVKEYNPHGIIIEHNTPLKGDNDMQDVITLIKLKRPTLRVIYVYGNITNEQDFEKIRDFLGDKQIFDIVTSQDNDFISELLEREPMTAEDLEETLRPPEETIPLAEEKNSEQSDPETKAEDAIAVDLNSERSLLSEFDIMEITTYNQEIPEIEEIKHITIGLTELMHHLGCTHTAFEIASFLSDRNKKACVVIGDDKTYNNLADFYEIDKELAEDGFLVEKTLNVFPYSRLTYAQEEFNYIVCDFGYPRPEQADAFADAHIKIMLCSGAEWDITTLMNYINLAQLDYIREIHYCFHPISQKKFIAHNKRLHRGRCKAYRLETSPDWLDPCLKNRDVYLKILKQYTNIVPWKRKKKRKK